MRIRARTDTNQKGLVGYLRARGASVQLLHTVGSGCPDLLVGFRGVTVTAEVKYEDGFLTADQTKWLICWNGSYPHILRTTDDCDKMLVEMEEDACRLRLVETTPDTTASQPRDVLVNDSYVTAVTKRSSIQKTGTRSIADARSTGAAPAKATRPRPRPRAQKARRRGRRA